NALMSKRRRKLVRISVGRGHENDHGSLRRLRYLTGSGCGFVIGGAVLGDFSGGGATFGSFVGDTGSSSGTTVYLRMGCPICATADLPWRLASRKLLAFKLPPLAN